MSIKWASEAVIGVQSEGTKEPEPRGVFSFRPRQVDYETEAERTIVGSSAKAQVYIIDVGFFWDTSSQSRSACAVGFTLYFGCANNRFASKERTVDKIGTTQMYDAKNAMKGG